ncbi:MAG TPA: hypothetical protein VI363_06985, partial [Burkholderiales bacterium]
MAGNPVTGVTGDADSKDTIRHERSSRMTAAAMETAGGYPKMIGTPKPETKIVFAVVLLAVGALGGCSGGDGGGAANPSFGGTATSADVLTYNNDNIRSGQNLQETALTPG